MWEDVAINHERVSLPMTDAKLYRFFVVRFWQDPAHYLSVEGKQLPLKHASLQPGVSYIVDVKAKFCPGNDLEGPWSEWSSTAEMKTAGTFTEIGGRIVL